MYRRLFFFRVALRSGTGFTDGSARPGTQRTFEAAARGGNLPRGAVLLLAALLVASLTVASRAEAFVYWSGNTGGIGRANLDGTGADNGFIFGYSCGVAVDGTHIYWADQGAFPSSASIGRANLDGPGVVEDFIPIPADDAPCGVAVDGAHIYWANAGSEISWAGQPERHRGRPGLHS